MAAPEMALDLSAGHNGLVHGQNIFKQGRAASTIATDVDKFCQCRASADASVLGREVCQITPSPFSGKFAKAEAIGAHFEAPSKNSNELS